MRAVLLALTGMLAIHIAPPLTIDLAVAARALHPGELVLVRITTSEPVTAVRGRAFGRPLAPWRVDDTTWRALAGIDLDIKPGMHEVTVEAGPASAPGTPARA